MGTTPIGRLALYFVGRAAREDAGQPLYNAFVRYRDGSERELDWTPSHSRESAQRVVDYLNARDGLPAA